MDVADERAVDAMKRTLSELKRKLARHKSNQQKIAESIADNRNVLTDLFNRIKDSALTIENAGDIEKEMSSWTAKDDLVRITGQVWGLFQEYPKGDDYQSSNRRPPAMSEKLMRSDAPQP